MSSLNLFDILPGTFIQTALATKTRYDNLDDLYNLSFEIRGALLDLLRLKKLSLRHGLVFYSGILGDGYTKAHTEPSLIDYTSHLATATPSLMDHTYIGDSKVIQVSAGEDRSLFLCEDGSVFSCCFGIQGRLGDGNTREHPVGTLSPIDLSLIGARKVIQVAAGESHYLFLCDDGSVFSSGDGTDGRLGNGNTDLHIKGIPSLIDSSLMGECKVIQVAAGSVHSLFLCEDGSVFSTGNGQFGVLGDGNTGHHKVGIPSPIDSSLIGTRKVIQVSAGSVHSLFLCEDGSVFSSGYGEFGMLGDSDTSKHNVGIPSPIDSSLIGARKVIQVFARSYISLFLCEDGSVFSSGFSIDGILGDGDASNYKVGTPSPIDITYIGDRKVIQIATGEYHSLFLCEDGSVFSCGLGIYGILGDGNTSKHPVGTPSPIDTTNLQDKKVIQIAAARSYSLFLT